MPSPHFRFESDVVDFRRLHSARLFFRKKKKRKTTTAATTTTTKRRRSTRNRFLHNRISPPPLWTYSDSRFEIFLKEEILESNQIPRIQYRIRWPGCLSHRRPRDSQPFGSGPTYREENVNPNGKPTEMSAGFFFVYFFLFVFFFNRFGRRLAKISSPMPMNALASPCRCYSR